MKERGCNKSKDYGPKPYVADIEQLTTENTNFRTAIWTGCHLQMTVMCIPACGEIGLEVHPDTDQFIRIERGCAVVKIGKCSECPDFCRSLKEGDAVFIPAGMWHNVINDENLPLQVSVFYAPPNHPRGTVHHTKMDAED